MATVTNGPWNAAPARAKVKRVARVLAISVVAFVPFSTTASAQIPRSATRAGTTSPVASTAAVGYHSRSVRSNARLPLPAQPVAVARALVHTVVGIQLPCYPNNVNQWYRASRGCPVTPQFRRYLLAHMRDVDPICQCQNYALHNTFHLLFQRAGLAAVAATLTFTYNTVYIVFVEVKGGGGWAATANYVTHT